MTRLLVWCRDEQVGILEQESTGALDFSYATTWRRFPISISLPLPRIGVPPPAGFKSAAQNFFANLLPEEGPRQRVEKRYRISPGNDFALLAEIGGECAGALSILREGQQPLQEYRYHPLSDNELTELLRLRNPEIDVAAHERPRLSLAGAQDKIPVYMDGARISLPLGNAPSNAILKFESTTYHHLPAYETTTMWLAAAVGLPVAKTTWYRHGKMTFSLSERFDRVTGEYGITRLHQEDLCQASGISPKVKYEKEGGPSFAAVYNLVRDHSAQAAQDGLALLRWQIFNVLAGNSDGHAKNLAIIHGSQIKLAPFYDLVCTRAVEGVDYLLSMAVGGQFAPGQVQPIHWRRLAEECEIKPVYVERLVQTMASALPDKWDKVEQTFEAKYGAYPALQRVRGVVHRQCHRVLISFTRGTKQRHLPGR